MSKMSTESTIPNCQISYLRGSMVVAILDGESLLDEELSIRIKENVPNLKSKIYFSLPNKSL